MANRGEHTYREISTQGEAWQSALDAVAALRGAAPGRDLVTIVRDSAERGIVFIGCGSTHHLAQYAAPIFQQITGIPCKGLPSSELLWQTDSVISTKAPPLVIALSRSGETSETVMAVEKVCALGGSALGISCYADTSLGAATCGIIHVERGREQSYAQTRSFAGMLVAVQALAAATAENDALLAELERLPGLAERAVERAEAFAQGVGPDERIERVTYLGAGPLYGLAGEATVKMKEMSLSVAEPYHIMEFRHGPMALVDEAHLVVALLSEGEALPYEIGVLHDLQERGTRIVAVVNSYEGLPDSIGQVYELESPLSPLARGVLYMPLLQWLAYYRAMARGLDPDRPRNVVMAIRLQGTRMAGAEGQGQ